MNENKQCEVCGGEGRTESLRGDIAGKLQGGYCNACGGVGYQSVSNAHPPPAAGPWIFPVEGKPETQPPKNGNTPILGNYGIYTGYVVWNDSKQAWVHNICGPVVVFAKSLDCFARLDFTGAAKGNE
jgi:hypothetical protein